MKFIEVTTKDGDTILLNTDYISEIGKSVMQAIHTYIIIKSQDGYNILDVIDTYEDIKAQLEGTS